MNRLERVLNDQIKGEIRSVARQKGERTKGNDRPQQVPTEKGRRDNAELVLLRSQACGGQFFQPFPLPVALAALVADVVGPYGGER